MKFIKIILSLLICLTSVTSIIAEDDFYYVYSYQNDGSIEKLDYFSKYSNAYEFFKNNINNYDNIGIVYNDKLIEVDKGVASLRNDDCTENISFVDTHNKAGYINGCYIGDLAYIKTNRNAESVRLKASGTVADFDIDDVTLYPYNQLKVRLSSYTVIDGVLYHQISTSMKNNIYASMLKMGKAPSYLGNDIYYSYDGHYFYNDYLTLINDYRNDNYSNSINPDDPYYSYYMYLPQRTYTNYTSEEISAYLKDVLLIESKIDYYYDLNRDSGNDILNTSQYYNETDSFFRYQYQYGANALMMLSLSFNESAYGRSRFAYNRNNLFGHSAYDNDIEKNASRYSSIDSSVKSHAKYYVSGNYGNARKYAYTGSYLGNKQSGMNINYASDPYWGEKAAHFAYTLDEALGLKDYNSYKLGIIEKTGNLNVYANKSLTSIAYQVKNFYNYAVTILGETDNAYMIAMDIPSDNETYIYDFSNQYGYIRKDAVDHLVTDNIKESDYVKQTYIANGGTYDGEEELTVIVDDKHNIPMFTPKYDGFEFVRYNIEEKEGSSVYSATYKEIEKIEVINPPREVELNWYLDLRDTKLVIYYKGIGKVTVPVTSDMVSGFDLSTVGEYEAFINYCGLETSFPLTVSSELDFIRAEIYELKDKEELLLNDAYRIKELSPSVLAYYSMDDVRRIDSLIYEDTNSVIDYVIDKNDLKLGVSGLGLAVEFSNLTTSGSSFRDSITVKTSTVVKKDEERLSKIAAAYGYVPLDYFKLDVYLNLEKTKLNAPLVFSISPAEYDSSLIYMVYLLNDDGDLIKCNTSVSDGSIEFETLECGSFVLSYKKTNNEFVRYKRVENTNIFNSAISFAEYFLKIMLGLVAATVVAIAIVAIMKKRKPYGRKITKINRRSRNLFKKKS